MTNKISKIKFYFPKINKEIINEHELVDFIIKEMKDDGGIKFAGYLKEDDLKKDLLRHYENNKIIPQNISTEQKITISNAINTITEKCQKALPHPNLPIFVYVYPWFPESESQLSFGGVTAFAEYLTMHLFINLNDYSVESIEKTVAHEWNHLVYYRNHTDFPYSLLTYMVMEGCAEVFREEITGGKPAPWSLALTENESKKQLELLEKDLDKKGMEIYRDVFFGTKKIKKWTGYAIGYRLVNEFRKNKHDLSWEEILNLDPEHIKKEAQRK